MENRLRAALAAGRFAVTVEVVTPGRDRPLAEGLGPARALAEAVAGDRRVVALGVTDRVRTDDDHDPVEAGVALAAGSGVAPLVHLSGKDRTPADLARSLGRLAEAGLDNVLCVTGDRLRTPPAGRPARYLDSVHAVAIARALRPSALVAAGVSPFKYTEEEAHSQYFKMARKHAAGADCLVTQVGWDMAKLAELIRYRRQRGLDQPVLANLMALPPGVARRLHAGAVPGVVVTDDLLALVEAEARAPDRGREARLDRLGLQMVGAERLGYAGVQLSGLAAWKDVDRVLALAAGHAARLPAVEDWRRAWEDSLRLPGGAPARLAPAPAYFLFGSPGRDGGGPPAAAPTRVQRLRYLALRTVHGSAFHPRSPLFPLLRRLARAIPPGSRMAAAVEALERRIKAPLVGCSMCGYCRLPDTFYVCPETCPKGLANGPCGGSTGNTCEAGDRECVHSIRYRLAKAAGALHRLEAGLIPPVPEPRGGSSWLAHFQGRDPRPTGRDST